MLKDFIDFLWVEINDISFIEKWIYRRKLIKERKDKIKRGIIRITESDPYGEEEWN